MNNKLYDSLAFLGRILIAIIFIYGGIGKIMGYRQTVQLMQAHHLNGYLLPAVIALELLGGLVLVYGLLTRLVPAALSIFSIAAISIIVLPPPNQVMLILVLAELGLVGGLLSYVASGPGHFSLDHVWLQKT